MIGDLHFCFFFHCRRLTVNEFDFETSFVTTVLSVTTFYSVVTSMSVENKFTA